MNLKSYINRIIKEEIAAVGKHILFNVVERPSVRFNKVIGNQIDPDDRILWPHENPMVILEPMSLSNKTFQFSEKSLLSGDKNFFRMEATFVASNYPNEFALEKQKAASRELHDTDKIEGFRALIGSRVVWVSKYDVGSIKEAMTDKEIKRQEAEMTGMDKNDT